MKIASSLIALVLTAFVSLAADNTAAVQAEFVKLYANWDHALVKADLATLDKIYADEARLTDPDGVLQTKASFLGQVKAGEYRAENTSTLELVVKIYGETAVATSVWKATETFKGQKTDGNYRFTDTWVKRDGRWQVVASQGTPNKKEK